MPSTAALTQASRRLIQKYDLEPQLVRGVDALQSEQSEAHDVAFFPSNGLLHRESYADLKSILFIGAVDGSQTIAISVFGF